MLILRIATNESGDKEKLIKILDMIIEKFDKNDMGNEDERIASRL